VTSPPNPSVPLKQNEYSPFLSDKKKKKKKKESVERLKTVKKDVLGVVEVQEFSLSQFQLGHNNRHKCAGCGDTITYQNKSGLCRGCNLKRARIIRQNSFKGKKARVIDAKMPDVTHVKGKHCLKCGRKLSRKNKSGYCQSCSVTMRNKARAKHEKKTRAKTRVCANCGNYLGERNISGFCKDCRKGHETPIFDAPIKVILVNGKKMIIGPRASYLPNAKEKREGLRVQRRA